MPTLGEVLRAARLERGFSLRDVERATKNRVSNGYLSLLESNEVKSPSPNHLHHLAKVYALSYADLMRLAGYYMPPALDSGTGKAGGARRPAATASALRGIALSAEGLSSDDIRNIEQYADFLRNRRSDGGSERPSEPTGEGDTRHGARGRTGRRKPPAR